jgi:hypothetical protein
MGEGMLKAAIAGRMLGKRGKGEKRKGFLDGIPGREDVRRDEERNQVRKNCT